MTPKRSLNIIIDIRPLMGGKVSGVEVYIHHLLEHLFTLDQENNYLLYTNAFAKVTANLLAYKRKNVTIIQTFVPNKLLNIGIFLFNRPYLDKLLPPQYLAPNFPIDIFFQPDLRPAAISKGIKKINVVHDLSFHHYPECFSWKARLWYKIMNPQKQLKKSDHIIAVSAFTKQDLISTYHLPPEKISVIYEGVDTAFCDGITEEKREQVKKKYSLPEHYILFLATLEPRKNMGRLIKAFQKYTKEHHSNTKLVMAGVTNPKIFSKYKIKPDPHIILTGFIEEEDKATLYTMAQAFIYPSLFEGFGLPLLEAMKCQTPTITSHSSSMPEIVKDAALLIDPLNIDAIAKALYDIQQPEVKAKLKAKMAERIKNFDWKKCAEETHKTILTLAYNREQK